MHMQSLLYSKKYLNKYSYHFEDDSEMKSREISAFILNYSRYMIHTHLYHHHTRIRNLPSFHSRLVNHQPILPLNLRPHEGRRGVSIRIVEIRDSLHLSNFGIRWLKSIFGQITNTVLKLHQRSTPSSSYCQSALQGNSTVKGNTIAFSKISTSCFAARPFAISWHFSHFVDVCSYCSH